MTSDLQTQLQEILGRAYHIDRELGGGGMSRVFVATELELDRKVVVKVLPPDLAAEINSDRFRREIQLAARLQHPHIVPLLAAGARGSLLYYTMPFIEGENLRARLTRMRELPVPEATKIIREIADALSYAHSQGVVHRDIKPENILLSGGHALVTDFGVSKAVSSATAETPTGRTLTSVGMALGTPAYMAPEQAAADPQVDHRADIYALGILAYELLTGFTPFSGQNQQQILAAHIATAPRSIIEYRPQIARGLADAIMRCLEKRAADRWQSARELHDALESYAFTTGATGSAAAAHKPFKWTPQRIAVAAGVLGLVTTALVASTIAFRGERSGLIIGNTQQITSAPGLEIHPSISPDGRMIAYIAGTPGVRSRLFVRQLSGGRAIALTDSSANVRWPRWSPDGSEILYGADEQKWIIPALGGSPTPVPGLDSLQQCTWSNSGDRFACARRRDGALIIADRGGGNHRIVTAGAADGVVAPAWSTDDKLIAFTKGNGDFLGGLDIGNLAPSSIWVIRAEGGTAVKVTDDTHLNTAPVWTSDGALLFVSSLGGTRDIYLQRLSGKLAPRGEPTRLTTGLNPHTISLSRDGRRLAYSVFNTVANIWTAPTGGSAESNTAAAKPVTSGNQTIEQGFVSPDGRWLAYDSNLNGNQDIYKLDLAGAEPQQLTRNDYDDFFPFWSPDGKEITFHSLKNGNRDLYVMDANGTNVRPVLEAPGEQLAPEWRDPQTIVYVGQTDSVFEVRRTRGVWGKPKFLFKASGGNYSPDGAQLIRVVDGGVLCKDCPPGPYVSRSDGSNARPIPVPRIQEVFEKGGAVAWSRDSRHAYAHIREKDGSASIWQLPINDDEEKRVLHFSDPARQPYRTTFDVYGGNIYFTIGDRQSDVWVMDLKKR